MTLKIFTFGWSPEFVIRPLLEEGASKEDIVLLLSAKPESEYTSKRVEEAFKQVKSFLDMAGVPEVVYREIDVNRDVIDICRDIVNIVKEWEKGHQNIKFYLTGGMRVLVIATLIVARLLSLVGRDVEVKTSREDRPVSYIIPLNLLNLDIKLTNSQIEILKHLRIRGEGTFEELAIGRSEVTVRKHLTKLREKGLVSCSAKGRKLIYKLTPLGELLLDITGFQPTNKTL